MAWKVKLIHKQEQKMSKWSGGTTTELALYPLDSCYKEQNFMWRISTATVDEAESTFTSLPAYNRILMPLRGDSLLLKHENQYNKVLHPLETDSFPGSWKTVSEGKVQDFNLMFTDDCGGFIHGYRLNGTLTIDTDASSLSGPGKLVTTSLYICGGPVKVDLPSQNYSLTLVDGDFVTFTGSLEDDPAILTLTLAEEAAETILACTTVKY